ncbi:MAG: hypothetical protein KF884_10775 [Fimbriimonadaceae bacterium]|nr:hypothetical protein [Fimbriimonadaceae bacterium]QYK58030.1 MAG: hypothetical protein KF884_10775 [Fimbriimonadaceae bacterium]
MNEQTMNEHTMNEDSRRQAPTTLPPRGKREYWKLSDGRIHRKVDGETVVAERLLGWAQRFGRHVSVINGEQVETLELELETEAGGRILVQTNLKSTVASAMMAERLLQLSKDDYVAVEAGGKDTPKGGTMTFVYVSRWRQDEGWIQLKSEGSEKSCAERLTSLLERLEQCPLYSVRVKSDERGGATHRSLLDEHLSSRGWPTTYQAPEEWRKACEKASGRSFKSVDDVDEDTWGEARLKIEPRAECPKFLAEAMKRLDEHDPFAND